MRFESNVLGNDLGVSTTTLKRLESIPTYRLQWVTKTRKAAERYGERGEVESVDMGCYPEIIAEDGDDGFLVLRTD